MTLTPAYGRDYRSKKSVEEDFNANKDFIVADIMSPYDGKPVNKQDLKEDGWKIVNIRYAKLTRVVVVPIR